MDIRDEYESELRQIDNLVKDGRMEPDDAARHLQEYWEYLQSAVDSRF